MRAGGTNEGPRLERRVVYSLQAAMPLVVLGLSTSIIAAAISPTWARPMSRPAPSLGEGENEGLLWR
jgi:hypothetical protein